jgi:Flp pilus assembly protein TadD
MRFALLGGTVLIAALAGLAYAPSLNGGFIWDDSLYLTNCDLIKAPDGLYRFWFTTEPIDYWPLSNTSLWLEWRLWGMHPTGYRVTNLLLHICVALLIWAVLKRLSMPGAFLAALLFVVHPVNVESVAWIAQRKGLLAMVFLLLSTLSFLRAIEPPSAAEDNVVDPKVNLRHSVSNRWYWLSLAAFLLAMLSKGSVAFLPVILLGIVWWLRRRITLPDLLATIPFFVVAVLLTAVNIWFQKQHAGTGIRTADFYERLAGAGAVPWFYLSKSLLPINLLFVYPMWQIHPGNLLWWLPLCAAVVATVILWWRRNRQQTRALLFVWGIFCVALLPVFGFTDVYFMKFSLVADHYQYHALIAVVALLAAAWTVWRQATHRFVRTLAMPFAVVVVGALTILSFQQSKMYKDVRTVWQTTLEKNPDCPVALNNLGVILAGENNQQEALRDFLHALRINSTDPEAHNNLGALYFKMGQPSDAIEHYLQALKRDANNAETQSNLGAALAAIDQYQQAIAHYKRALELNPKLIDTKLNLGIALMHEGSLQEALEQFNQFLRFQPDNIKAYVNLVSIYAQLDRSPEAIAAAQKALELAEQQGQTALVQQIGAWLTSYRNSSSQNSPEPSPAAPKTSPSPIH